VPSDIVFDLHTPVIIEKEDYHRTLTGDERKDSKGFRHRLIAFDDAHAVVAPYAHHLRLTVINEKDLFKFEQFCRVSNIPTPVRTFDQKFNIEASRRRLFSVGKLKDIRRWVASFQWPTAFQIEVLIHNALVNTDDLLNDLKKPIMREYDKDPAMCAELLRHYVEYLQAPTRPRNEPPLSCFNRVLRDKRDKSPITTSAGMFSCRHVTFTPTRLILEGP
jgi:RNA-dependent RNA polymerase